MKIRFTTHLTIVFLLVTIFSNSLKAQDSSNYKEHRINFGLQYFQIKEAANYGLVFNGLNLALGYDFTKETNRGLTGYSTDLAFGVNFRKGAGLNWHFKPIDLFYGFQLLNRSKKKK
jgi:hypothetical protein